MKKLLPVALVAISLLSMTLFFVEQSKQIHAASETSLVLYEHDTTTRFFGDKKTKNGQYETYTNPVYDATDKIRTGSSDGTCIYVSEAVYQCEWTMALPGGKLVLSGADTIQDQTTTYAVVGGTGTYSAAKGEASLYFFHGAKYDEYKYTFTLV
jgi:hypothetical protein